MAGLYNGECLPWEWFVVSDYCEEHSEYCTSLQGCSQDFSKGGSQQGHHPGIADYIMVYTRYSPSCISGLSHIIAA